MAVLYWNLGSGAPMKVFFAVALFGLAFLMVYIAVASPQQGTAMGAIRDVLLGLGGGLAAALPLVLASAPSWEWACLPDTYALLAQWTPMNHQDALGLLHAT
jgi:hypothetical protein